MKKSKKRSPRILAGLFGFFLGPIVFAGVFLFSEPPVSIPSYSSEFGAYDVSPRGEEGGRSIPASCETDPPNPHMDGYSRGLRGENECWNYLDCSPSVSAAVVQRGQSVSVSWTPAMAASVYLDGVLQGWPYYSGQTFNPGEPGVRRFGIHIADDANSTSYDCSIYVTVVGPSATCSANKTTALTGEPVTWTAVVSGGQGPYAYEWQRGNGSALGTGNPLVLTYGDVGPKNAQVVVTDSNGVKSATTTCSNNVTVTGAPDLTSSGLACPSVIVHGIPVTFSATVNNVVSTAAGPFWDAVQWYNEVTAAWEGHYASIEHPGGLAGNSSAPDVTGASAFMIRSETPGSVKIRHCVDSTTNVTEGNENNNCSATVTCPIVMPLTPGTCSAIPNPGTVDSPVTWSVSGVTGGSGNYTYAWGSAMSGVDSLSGTGASVNKTYTAAGTKTAYVVVSDATHPSLATRTINCTNEVINVPAAQPDLTSLSLTISAAPYTQGTALMVTGVARNIGGVGAPAFTDNITHRWGTSGAWLDSSGNTFAKPALNPATNASSDVLSFTPTQTGTNLYFQHCVDSAIPGTVSESNETNNCQTIGPFTVVPPTPTGLTATPQACNTGQINLSWNTVAGATSYDIEKDGVVTTLGNVTTHTHTGLTAGSNHAYRVRVTVGGVTSAWSAVVNQTAPATCAPPDLTSTMTQTLGGTNVPTYTPLRFVGVVRNTGAGATGVGFIDRYYYSFNGGVWVSGGDISKAALGASPASSADGAFNITPTSPGTYDFYHCVDQTNTVWNESNEGNNCSTPITVTVTIEPTTCSASPTTATIGQLVTWTATQPEGGVAPYTYIWSGSVSGSGITLTTSYATAGGKTARVSVSDSLGQPFGTNVPCANSVTVVPGSFPNLISQNFAVSNGPYAQGTPINLTAQVRNAGSVSTGVPFQDRFTVQWGGTSGAWSNFSSTINQPTLAAVTTSATPDTAAYTPTQAGNVYFQHCVDSANNVNEDTNETPNCVVIGPYVISAPPLPPPTGLTATPGLCGTGAITVTWNAVSGATAYQLYEGATLLQDSATRSFTHTGLAAGSSHTYTARASNASGVSALSAPVSATTAAACPRPDLISLNHIRTDGGAGTVVLGTALSFSAQVRNQGPVIARDDVTLGNFSDRFQYSTDEGATWSTIRSRTQTPLAAMTTSTTTDTTGSFTPLTAGTYRIRHCADIGAVVTESNETNNCTETNPVIVIGPEVTCSVSPTTANVSENVTWTAVGTGGTAPYTYQWVVYPGESDSPVGATNPLTKSYSTIGDKHAQVRAWDSLGQQTPLRTCTNSVTVSAGNLPNLISQNFTVAAGPYVQGTPIDLSAEVRNIGTVTTGAPFRDNLSVQWGGVGGAWTPVIATINQPTLAALTTSATRDTASYTPTQAGSVYFQHCVDSNTDIDEGAGETPNCVQKGPYLVTTTDLTVSCSVSPTTADIGDNVTWTALGADGTTPYEYRWYAYGSETDGPVTGWLSANSTGKSYATAGIKHARVQVRESATPSEVSLITTCTNSVNVGLLPASVALSVSTYGTGAKPRTTNDITIIDGEEVRLWWDGTNVTSCGGIGFLTGTTAPDGDQLNVDEPVTGSRTYRVDCTGSGTPSPVSSNSIVVTKLGPPTIVVPPRVRRGDTIQITGNTGGSTTCTLEGTNVESNGDNSVDLAGISGPFPTQITGDINETTTFSIECGAAGRDEGTVTILGTFEEV